MNKDLRWKQRFSNYQKAFVQLTDAVSRKHYDKLEQAGLIQMFEIVFELAWKVLGDKLEHDGITANSPREIIKAAFKHGYIQDGAVWIEALGNRNLLAHTYDEAKSDQARDLIRGHYFTLLKALYDSLKKESTR